MEDEDGDEDEDEDEDDDGMVSGEEGGEGGGDFEDGEDPVAAEMAALRAEEKEALEGIAHVDDDEINQGHAVREQKQIWEDLLEVPHPASPTRTLPPAHPRLTHRWLTPSHPADSHPADSHPHPCSGSCASWSRRLSWQQIECRNQTPTERSPPIVILWPRSCTGASLLAAMPPSCWLPCDHSLTLLICSCHVAVGDLTKQLR